MGWVGRMEVNDYVSEHLPIKTVKVRGITQNVMTMYFHQDDKLLPLGRALRTNKFYEIYIKQK